MSSSANDEEGTPTEQILEDNGVGRNNGYCGSGYTGTELAYESIEQFCEEYVDDKMIISSRSIANAVDHERTQEIGKTLAAHLNGRTPDEFLTDVEVSKWSDTQPIKWTFVRTAGEVDRSRSRRLSKVQLVREISDATGVEGARFRTVSEDGTTWERAKMTIGWMHEVLEAVCEAVDYTPQAIAEQDDDDDQLTRREWIGETTQAGATQVLERALGIDAPGAETSWNKPTVRAIHEVLIEGRDPSEVRS